MNKAPIGQRGVAVVVDTTGPAEFDLQGYRIGDAMLTRWANRLVANSFAAEDEVRGTARMRIMDGYAVFFSVGRENGGIVITIFAVKPDSGKDILKAYLRRLSALAIFRGATGV